MMMQAIHGRAGAAALFGGLILSAAVMAAIDPTLVARFETGFDAGGTPLTVPSIDPSGVTFHAPSGHLFIVDSEIEEVPEAMAVVGANLFELSPDGSVLYGKWSLLDVVPRNAEPTGIVFNPVDGFFYVLHNSKNRVFRYGFDGQEIWFDDYQKHTWSVAGTNDPEGITVDPATGRMYIVDGRNRRIVPFTYDESTNDFLFDPWIDLAALNDELEVPKHPQGITFDVETGHLLLVSRRDRAIFEYTTDGLFVDVYDIRGLDPRPRAPQGLTFGPTSDPGDDPSMRSLYMVDAGIDNDVDPDERDGAVYETEFAGGDPTPVCPDLDDDGWVGIRDLLILLKRFGHLGSPADFDDSGRVDLPDLQYLLDGWGPCP